MKSNVKLENEIISKLAEELLEDVTVNLMNVRDKSMLVSTIRTQWVMKFFKEKELVKKLKNAKRLLLDQGVDDLQVKDTANRHISRIRLEADVYASNPKLKKIENMLVTQNEVIKFLEYALNIVSDFNFTVKYSLDAIKLEQT